MATLTKKKVNCGLYTQASTPTFAMKNYATLDASAETGDAYINAPDTWLELKNSGTTVTVQITAQKKIRGLLRHIRFSVASGNHIRVPVLPDEYTNPTTGLVEITYPSGWSSSLTVAALQMSQDPFEEASA